MPVMQVKLKIAPNRIISFEAYACAKSQCSFDFIEFAVRYPYKGLISFGGNFKVIIPMVINIDPLKSGIRNSGFEKFILIEIL